MKKKKIVFRSDCSISTALDIFGDKWSLLIIRDMMFKGKKTYGDFLEGGEKIATNILADRLALLEMAGVISKSKHPDSKAKVLYKLTQKGINLLPLLIEVIIWSTKYDKNTASDIKFVNRAKRDREGLLKKITSRLKKETIA